MSRGGLDDLAAFAAVARAGGFTRAAAELGMSVSNLSHTVGRLERRLRVRLLARNSRSVVPTEAGRRLLDTIGPALDGIAAGLDALREEDGRVSGTVRVTASRQGYERVVRPMLGGFLRAHPEAAVEVSVDHGLRDIVADRFDAGIRSGEDLRGDTVAVRVGPALRMAVVAAPEYLRVHGVPGEPRELLGHRCINYRLLSADAEYAWEFERDGRAFTLRVPGPLMFSDPGPMLDCALDGLGIAFLLEDLAAPHVAAGRLVRLLAEWTAPFPGFFLFHSSRRQMRPVLAAFIAAVRAAAAG